MSGMHDLSLGVSSASVTAKGGRTANEDSLASVHAACGSCYVVSDGAGGHFGGAIASRIVVDAVIEEARAATAFSADVLEQGFKRAQAQITARQRSETSLSSMSATVAALLIENEGRLAVWGHLGDTRLLHFRSGTLQSVTRDHSLVQRLVDAGYVAADHAAGHPSRNLLYGALGAEGDTAPVFESGPVELRDGDAFLLCTDGFWGRIAPERIEQQLRFASDVDAWLAAMKDIVAADMPSGADNYSAVGVWIGSPADVTVTQARLGDAA
jgi:serine/threonine protein phosphatase PrpC